MKIWLSWEAQITFKDRCKQFYWTPCMLTNLLIPISRLLTMSSAYLALCLNSVLNVKALTSRRIQPGKGPSRGLLRDYKTSPINRLQLYWRVMLLVGSGGHSPLSPDTPAPNMSPLLPRSVPPPAAPRRAVPRHAKLYGGGGSSGLWRTLGAVTGSRLEAVPTRGLGQWAGWHRPRLHCPVFILSIYGGSKAEFHKCDVNVKQCCTIFREGPIAPPCWNKESIKT